MNRLSKLLAAAAAFAALLLPAGCGNLSPRDNLNPKDNFNPHLQQQIDNQNGKIDRIESNQNSIKLQLESRHENTNNGWQFFQGDGGLLLAFGIVSILCVTGYFYRRSTQTDRMVTLLVEQIKSYNDPDLEERVLRAALYTPVEKELYHKMTRHGL